MLPLTCRGLSILMSCSSEETAKIYSSLDEEDYNDPFLCCDDLEEDETVIDDDQTL